MQTQTKAKGKGGVVLCTAYCPVCRTHWQTILPVRTVTTAGERGQGYPFHPHPTCAAASAAREG